MTFLLCIVPRSFGVESRNKNMKLWINLMQLHFSIVTLWEWIQLWTCKKERFKILVKITVVSVVKVVFWSNNSQDRKGSFKICNIPFQIFFFENFNIFDLKMLYVNIIFHQSYDIINHRYVRNIQTYLNSLYPPTRS